MFLAAITLSSIASLFYNFHHETNGLRRLEGSDCPKPAKPEGSVVLFIIGVLYFLIFMAIIADELFVPSLQLIAEGLKLSPNVAGATLMAAGGSSPELFTSLVGTFLMSDVGFGTIVSNISFHIGFS